MLRAFLILASLFSVSSCIALSRSDIIDHDEIEAISIFSIEIIYDGKSETKHSGLTDYCQVRFHNDKFENVRFRHEKDSKFYLLKDYPGITIFYNMYCMHYVIPPIYLKTRKTDLSGWAFLSYGGHINYAGHITINYKPTGFSPSDVVGLGGLRDDTRGKIEIKIEDRIDEAVKFIRQNYPELINMPIARSLLTYITSLKVNDKPDIYQSVVPQPIQQSDPQAAVQPVITPPVVAPTAPSESTNSPLYFDPYQNPQSKMPYYNPYENHGPAPSPVN